MAISKEEAEAILQPVLENLGRCIDTAVRTYFQIPPVFRVKFSKRTQSSIVNDFMVFYGQEYLKDQVVWERSKKNHQYACHIGGILKMKLKMLDRQLRPRSIPTQEALGFIRQEQLDLPGVTARLTHIIAGYRWNQLRTGHDGIYVTCPYDDQVLWVIKISPEQPQTPELVATPPTPIKPTPRRVMRKEAADESQERSSG